MQQSRKFQIYFMKIENQRRKCGRVHSLQGKHKKTVVEVL